MSESSSFLPTHAALMPLPEATDALPAGTRVGEFEIREVIGVGGFGVVYRAWEPALDRVVALKEYLPVGQVTRLPDGRVALRSRHHEEDFLLGLKSFVNEARLLARFDHPALVKVHRFWEANGTAYMAMPFYKAQTLRQRRQDMGLHPPTQDWLLAIIEPLLGALAQMHRADVYHRDIAPDNILWCEDDRPVLLDFGAARQALADRTQALTAILKPQFAPIEQYADAKSMRQGPWTDIFALASTCYFMLTGRPPVPATARILTDELTPLAELAPAGFSTQVLATLDWAMSVHPEDRPQSVAAFWDALRGHLKVPVRRSPRPLPPARADEAPAGFARTIQVSAASTARWGTTASVFAALGRTTRDPAPEPAIAAPAAWRAVAARARPTTWALLALLGFSAGALAWMGVRPAPPAAAAATEPAMPVGAAALPASAASAPSTGASAPAATAAHQAVPVAPAPARDKRAQALGDRSTDAPVREEIAWADAHEAAASAPRRTRAAPPSTPSRPVSVAQACSAGDATQRNACVKRLCRTDPRLGREKACHATVSQSKRWWQFWRSG
jgi:serine/threonine protein kinase